MDFILFYGDLNSVQVIRTIEGCGMRKISLEWTSLKRLASATSQNYVNAAADCDRLGIGNLYSDICLMWRCGTFATYLYVYFRVLVLSFSHSHAFIILWYAFWIIISPNT